jgi:two-component system response regulator YesN
MMIKMTMAVKEADAEAVKSLLDKKIVPNLEKELENFGAEAITVTEQDLLFCAFLYTPERDKKILEWTGGLLGHFKALLGEYGEFRLTIGLGSAARRPDELSAAVLTAWSALNARFVRGADRVIFQETLPNTALQFSDVFPAEQRDRLLKAIEAFDTSAFSNICVHLFNTIRNSSVDNVHLLFEASLFIARMLQDSYGLRGGDAEQQLQRLSGAFDYREFETTFLSVTVRLIETIHEERKLHEEQPIRLAKNYIDEHFEQPLTLEEVASVAGLSPTYFSAVFKKLSDKNFSEYLTDRRIREAKKLLRDTTWNINEIADRVGYRDAKYFSKLFIKITGLKPKEFRRLYS